MGKHRAPQRFPEENPHKKFSSQLPNHHFASLQRALRGMFFAMKNTLSTVTIQNKDDTRVYREICIKCTVQSHDCFLYTLTLTLQTFRFSFNLISNDLLTPVRVKGVPAKSHV